MPKRRGDSPQRPQSKKSKGKAKAITITTTAEDLPEILKNIIFDSVEAIVERITEVEGQTLVTEKDNAIVSGMEVSSADDSGFFDTTSIPGRPEGSSAASGSSHAPIVLDFDGPVSSGSSRPVARPAPRPTATPASASGSRNKTTSTPQARAQNRTLFLDPTGSGYTF